MIRSSSYPNKNSSTSTSIEPSPDNLIEPATPDSDLAASLGILPVPVPSRGASNFRNTVIYGDCLKRLREMPSCFVQTVVTSPPYFRLRDYGATGQIGLESNPEDYVESVVDVFRELDRVLRSDGTVWLNIGDSYAGGHGGAVSGKTGKVRSPHLRSAGDVVGLKSKNLIGIPWRVAAALQAAGWSVRAQIVWHKPNGKPESVTDRPTRSYEFIFLLSKSRRYHYDAEAIYEPGRDHGKNSRDVWTIETRRSKTGHPAAFPPELPRRCILAGSRPGDLVLDPFAGSGTTLAVAKELGRDYLGIELNEAYRPLIEAQLRTGSARDSTRRGQSARTSARPRFTSSWD
jgi:DNA modification methylase